MVEPELRPALTWRITSAASDQSALINDDASFLDRETFPTSGRTRLIRADCVDIGKTIHPHPTLQESIGMAAEIAHGSCTDVPPARK